MLFLRSAMKSTGKCARSIILNCCSIVRFFGGGGSLANSSSGASSGIASYKANHWSKLSARLRADSGASTTSPVAGSRRMATSRPLKRNSLGRRTAWLRPFLNNLAVRVIVAPSRSRVYTTVYTISSAAFRLGGVFFPELAEFLDRGGGLAAVDGFCAHSDALLEVAGEVRGDEDGGGVEQDYVAARAGDAGKHVIEQCFVGFDVAAGEVIDCGALKAGHF